MQHQRLTRELEKMIKSPLNGIWFSLKEGQMNVLEASILGPENSAYNNGTFKLEIHIPDNYPMGPPTIKFLTKVYHPNIDDQGRICLDLLKMPPKGSWKPTIGIEGLLVAIRMLLGNPNPDDPLMAEIAEEFTSNREQFEKRVREYVNKYARSI